MKPQDTTPGDAAAAACAKRHQPVLPWMRIPISVEVGQGVPLQESRGLGPELTRALSKGALAGAVFCWGVLRYSVCDVTHGQGSIRVWARQPGVGLVDSNWVWARQPGVWGAGPRLVSSNRVWARQPSA